MANLQPDEENKYTNIWTVKDYRGPDRALAPDLEEKFRCFIRDCEQIGLSRCQTRCSLDIQGYIKQQKIQQKYFVDDKPGTFFKYSMAKIKITANGEFFFNTENYFVNICCAPM